MSRQSKRTSAPAPMEISPPVVHAVPSPRAQPVPPPAIPSLFGPGAWCPPQSVAPSSAPYWIAGQQHPSMAGPSAPGAWWAPAPAPGANSEDSDLQAWGSDSHPPGGFVNFLKKNTPSRAQPLSNGSLSQPINVGDDTNDGDCARTEKRLLWTKEEDLRLGELRRELHGFVVAGKKLMLCGLVVSLMWI